MSILDLGLGVIVGVGIGLLGTAAIYILMGPEARFHFKRVLKGRGLDLVYFNPLSGKFNHTGIRWNGKNWVSDDKNASGFYFGFDTLKEVATDEEKYNSALKYRAQWEGSKRSVVMGSQEMCFVYSPEFAAFLTKSLEAKTEGLEDDIKAIMKNLADTFKDGIKDIHLIQPVKPDVVRAFMDGETPRRLQEAHDNGYGEAVLDYTRPKKEMGAGLKLGIGVAVIVIVVAALIALTQGDAVRAMIQGLMGRK